MEKIGLQKDDPILALPSSKMFGCGSGVVFLSLGDKYWLMKTNTCETEYMREIREASPEVQRNAS